MQSACRASLPRLARRVVRPEQQRSFASGIVLARTIATPASRTLFTTDLNAKAAATIDPPEPQSRQPQGGVPSIFNQGAHVYCLDYQTEPSPDWLEAQTRVTAAEVGSLSYIHLDTRNHDEQEAVFAQIADKHSGIHGLLAGAGVNFVMPALNYPPEQVDRVTDINFKGVFYSAQACARQMIKYQTPGSMVLIASMSARVANRGLRCCVYNASKAAVDQLARSLAAEWSRVVDGKPIRVNSLCPGNVVTPMVLKNFADEPHLKAEWEAQNMLGRLSTPEEYNGAVLYLLSDASSFKTGASEIIDGGYTAW